MAIVNFESVAVAAEKIQAAGGKPSIRTIKAELGGGSPNTILALLTEWKKGRPVVRILDTELDTKITDAIKEQMQRFAEQAAVAAEERAAILEENLESFSEAQTTAEQQINALTTELDAATTAAALLAEQLKATQADASRAAEQATTTAAALRQELTTERTRQEATAAALAKAEVLISELPELKLEMEKLKATLEAEREAKQQAKQDAAVSKSQIDAAEKLALEIKTQSISVDDQRIAALKELEFTRAALAAAREHASNMKGRLDGIEAANQREDKKMKAAADKAEAAAAKKENKPTSKTDY